MSYTVQWETTPSMAHSFYKGSIRVHADDLDMDGVANLARHVVARDLHLPASSIAIVRITQEVAS